MEEGFRDPQLHVVGEAAAFATALDGFVGKGMPAGVDEVMIGESVLDHDFVQRLRAKVALFILLYHAGPRFLIRRADQARFQLNDMRILLSTTSYQDTPGEHHALLESQGFEIHRERGPLPESRMLELAGEFDAFLCGDDEITKAVLDKALPRLRVISKYGIGLDKIDVAECTACKLPVLFTPGVNHTTVAEHTFCLLLALVRNLVDSANAVRAGQWKRVTGHEIWNKTMGIVGLGRIGQEVAKRAQAFGMKVHALDPYWPEAFAAEHGVVRHEVVETMLPEIDVLSLHANLSESTRHLIRADRIALAKPELLVINTSRAELVHMPDMIAALDDGRVGGYGTDVLDEEPPPPDHPLLRHPKALITPHIGSRTFESVPRQALRATLNLVNFLGGKEDVIQANRW